MDVVCRRDNGLSRKFIVRLSRDVTLSGFLVMWLDANARQKAPQLTNSAHCTTPP
jgi:hypothetical protein